jgi:hypothetical protein
MTRAGRADQLPVPVGDGQRDSVVEREDVDHLVHGLVHGEHRDRDRVRRSAQHLCRRDRADDAAGLVQHEDRP